MPDLDVQIRDLLSGVEPVTAGEVIAEWSGELPHGRTRRLRSYAFGAIGMALAIGVLVVLLVSGVFSSRSAVTPSSGPAGVPASWQKLAFGGLSFYAPGNWPVSRQNIWGACGGPDQPMQPSTVVLDSGAQGENVDCPLTLSSAKPAYGLLVDPGPYGILAMTSGFEKCLPINGLSVCPSSTTYPSFRVFAAHIPGIVRPVAVEVGTAGGGKIEQTILNSMRPSGSKSTATPSPPPANLVAPGRWPEQTLKSSQDARDIAVTSDEVFWLSQSPYETNPPGPPVWLYRFDPGSGDVTRGPSTPGFIGTSSLAISDGWVWTAIGSGNDVVLKQINPLTLSVAKSESLPVEDGATTYPFTPDIVATVDGPLWMAGGEDLWALNPSTGAVETELKTASAISSMSTDPTGRLLYAASPLTADGGTTVTEYDARTGQELSQMVQAATTGAGTVAATKGGVWLSARSGMAGGTEELSAIGLTEVAPTASERLGFGTYDQIGGVWASVSEQTLWLTNESRRVNLTCADPTTGAVRTGGSTPMQVSAPVGDGQKLYAIASTNSEQSVVVITPPAECFG
jgi:hypothetical protein